MIKIIEKREKEKNYSSSYYVTDPVTGERVLVEEMYRRIKERENEVNEGSGEVAEDITITEEDVKNIELLAQLLYGEAAYGGGVELNRNERTYVAWTVKNRVARGGWYGSTYEEVIFKPSQYSAVDHNWYTYEDVPENQKDVFEEMREIAKEVYFADQSEDPIQGCVQYFSPYIPMPEWAKDMTYMGELEDDITVIDTKYQGKPYVGPSFKFYLD